MYFYFILNYDYEQMEEKATAETGETEGMSTGQESMCVLSKDRCVNVETEMDGNISNQPGKKRKHDDVFEMNNESDDAEVSTPQKKVCTSSSSTASGVASLTIYSRYAKFQVIIIIHFFTN